jgi:outer membrane biosynthesis protein TonB
MRNGHLFAPGAVLKGEPIRMTRTTVKSVFLALILASALPLAACSDDNDSPTSPTQPGPPVAENPTTPPPTPTPTPPPPTPEPTPPTPEPPSDTPVVSITGPVVNLERSGADGLAISFRIDDFTIVRAAANTPVMNGSTTTNTSAVLSGMTVTVNGRRTNGFLDATSIIIASQ